MARFPGRPPCPPSPKTRPSIARKPPSRLPAAPCARRVPSRRRRAAATPPRPSKSALLPEIARLAPGGLFRPGNRQAAGRPRRTVDRWLQELREQWAAARRKDAAQLVPVTLARLELAYREAMEAWRCSLADKEVTTETPGETARRRGEACVQGQPSRDRPPCSAR